MKLLLCKECSQIISITLEEWTVCKCKLSRARYLPNGSDAEVEGHPACLIAISNHDFENCLPFAELAEVLEERRLDSWVAFPLEACLLTWDSRVVKRVNDDGKHLGYMVNKATSDIPGALTLLQEIKIQRDKFHQRLKLWLSLRAMGSGYNPHLKDEQHD